MNRFVLGVTTLFADYSSVPIHEKNDPFGLFLGLVVAVFFFLFIFNGITRR